MQNNILPAVKADFLSPVCIVTTLLSCICNRLVQRCHSRQCVSGRSLAMILEKNRITFDRDFFTVFFPQQKAE